MTKFAKSSTVRGRFLHAGFAVTLFALGAAGVCAAQSTPPAAHRAGSIAVGEARNGILTSGEGAKTSGFMSALSAATTPSRTAGGSSPVDSYSFKGTAGQQLEFRMHAAPLLDPYLSIYGPGGFTQATGHDDLSDHPAEDSRLTVTLPANGEYRIEAASRMSGGAYTLTVVDGAAAVRDREQLKQQRQTRMADVPGLLQNARSALDRGDNATAERLYREVTAIDHANVEAQDNWLVAYNRLLDVRSEELGRRNQAEFDRITAEREQDDANNRARFQALGDAVRARQAPANISPQFAQQQARPQPQAPQQPSAFGGSPIRPAPPANQHLHNPANEGTQCVHVVFYADSNRFRNDCGWPISLVWPGGVQDLGRGDMWPTGQSGQFRFTACKHIPSIGAGLYRNSSMAPGTAMCEGPAN